jgi:glucose-6-phosphate-specific signal transduction histidine kinase
MQDGQFVLSIRDNGRGMTQDEKMLRFSHGLSGMRHRIQALGGRWEMLARERGGTEIRVEVPLANVLSGQAGRPYASWSLPARMSRCPLMMAI